MMANAGGNSGVFTNSSTIEGQDIESGSITEHVSNIHTETSPVEVYLPKMEEGQGNDDYVTELDKLVSSLEGMLENVPPYIYSLGHPGRISRIPENLREVDVRGYEPYILSIGPYHHGKARVQLMEWRKRLALKRLLQYKPELTLKDYLSQILNLEPVARSFYSNVEMNTESFVQMLLLDSVCLVTMLCGRVKSQESMNEVRVDNENADVGEQEMDDENLRMVRVDESNSGMNHGENWYWTMLTHDLFLVENQIPFFVLENIYNLAYGGTGALFMDIMKYEITYMLTEYTRQDPKKIILRTEEVHHLLHLCHVLFGPTIQQESTSCHFIESRQMFRLGSAVQLYEAGVRFEERSGLTNYSLLDITFDRSGKMAMPCLLVDDNTESLLRNLIALEQMKYPSLGLDISAYIVLLLHLITIPKDVELLRRKGIIQHHLASDKEMMYLINRLNKGLAFDYVEDKYSLKHVFNELNRYSERRGPRWRAWLKHRHFSNPWTAISLLAASILLLLTLVQTFYSVYSYYNPYFNGH